MFSCLTTISFMVSCWHLVCSTSNGLCQAPPLCLHSSPTCSFSCMPVCMVDCEQFICAVFSFCGVDSTGREEEDWRGWRKEEDGGGRRADMAGLGQAALALLLLCCACAAWLGNVCVACEPVCLAWLEEHPAFGMPPCPHTQAFLVHEPCQ